VDVGDFENLPENIWVFPQVDQIAVLKKADVFISHCGMNSVSESLYFEVPLVMFPQTSEQKGVAQRVLMLGAGVKPDKTDAEAVLSAANEVLSSSAYRQNAKKIADGFKVCTGAKGAADKIEKVCTVFRN
jgi:MGT family glycosyltransferase